MIVTSGSIKARKFCGSALEPGQNFHFFSLARCPFRLNFNHTIPSPLSSSTSAAEADYFIRLSQGEMFGVLF